MRTGVLFGGWILLFVLRMVVQAGVPLDMAVHSVVTLEPVEMSEALTDRVRVDVFLSHEPLGGQLCQDQAGQVYAFSSRRDRLGALTGMNGTSVVSNELLGGINGKAAAVWGNDWLVSLDYWPDSGNGQWGLFQLSKDGAARRLSLARTDLHGLGDVVVNPAGGWTFSDFERENVWNLSEEGVAETALITNAPPPGLYTLAYGATPSDLYVVNLPGGWPMGGDAAVYKVADGVCTLVAKAAAGASFSGLAYSDGRVFPEGFYASIPELGQIVRLGTDGAYTIVLSRLRNPRSLEFSTADGSLYVLCDGHGVMRFGLKGQKVPSRMKSFQEGKMQMDLGPVANVRVQAGDAALVTDDQGRVTFDNMPMGTVECVIDHPGFASMKQTVKVEKNAAPVILPIQSQDDLDITCRITDHVTGLPISGALIQLQPKKVKATIQGTFDGCTGFDGQLAILNVPEGLYNVTIGADGFEKQQADWDIRRTHVSFDIALSPKIQSKEGVTVAITDKLTGKALPNAHAVWEAAVGAGALLDALSDTRGMVRFSDIPVGQWTRRSEQNGLLMRRLGVITVTAEGYVPVSQMMELGGQPTTAIALTPVAEIAEQESNNSITEAQKVPIGVPIAFKIDRNDDVDIFQIELPTDGTIIIDVAEGPIQRYVLLMNKDGQRITDQGVYAGSPTHIVSPGLKAGTYFVQIEEWGRNGASPEKQMATIQAVPAPDPMEPNDTMETARLMRTGESVSGVTLPTGDQDYFRFHAPRPGVVQVETEPHALQRYIAIYDMQTNRLADGGVYAGTPLKVQARIPESGDYMILASEWGNNAESTEPYTITMDFVPDDGIDDPSMTNRPLRAARQMEPGTCLSQSIWPLGDSDLYEIKCPGTGRLHVDGTAPIQFYVAIYRPDGQRVTEKGVYENQKLRILYDCSGAETVYAFVSEWGDNNASSRPYTLSAWFEPSEDMEQAQRNETMETAFPLEAGEVLAGSIFPYQDQDYYQITPAFPGWLSVTGTTPLQLHLTLFDRQTNAVFDKGFYPPSVAVGGPVLPGDYWLRVMEWGNNDCTPRPYHLDVKLDRAEPAETVPLAEDKPRQLELKQAQSYSFDLIDDVDTFIYNDKTGTNFIIRCVNSMQTLIRVLDDETEALLVEKGYYEGVFELPIKAAEPRRYRIQLNEWGNNAHSLKPGYIMVSEQSTPIPADSIQVDVSGGRQLYFSRTEIPKVPRPEKVVIDVNGDGKGDVTVKKEGETAYRMPKAGIFAAKAMMSDTNGVTSTLHFWIDAKEHQAREGIMLQTGLEDGQVLTDPIKMSVHAISFSRAAVEKVSFTLDDNPAFVDYSPPYELPVQWDQLGPETHHLNVIAVDSRGNEATLERTFTLSPFFGLQPRDGAEISGENVMISWSGTRFGGAEVLYKEVGAEKWGKSVGEDGRFRTVSIQGLTPGKSYVYKAVSGKETSPERSFKLVKGLAFGRASYGANINRDYNQRVGISVRNNGEEPLTVRLECGQPADPLLLVGFVGQGSEDAPFELQPGEEREFMLGISAQDVMTAEHTFSVRITSEDGLADEAVVNLSVRLPKIELAWKYLGDTAYGLGRKYRIQNNGDTITDLAVSSDNTDVFISPAIFHGLLPAGRHVDVTVTPRLYDSFKSVQAHLIARGLNKTFTEDYDVTLADNEKLYNIYLLPEGNTMDTTEYDRMVTTAKAADKLSPESVDWTTKELPEDLNGDEFPDRWYVFAPDDVLWVGDDTDGNGEIDFVHADIGMDGVFEYSAFQKDGKWEETNIVEAWLEMGFTLPWNRNSYHPHDVDIVMNGSVIGRLRDTIPNGNYAFFIPPRAFRFNEMGQTEGNEIGIRSTHLRGGHYVVNSDFRFNIRLTATPVWSAGTNQADAYNRAMEIEGLSLDAPDYSVSSSEMELLGAAQLHSGMRAYITVPMRNLGATSPPDVPVVLMDKKAGSKAVEAARIIIPDVPESGSIMVRIPWTAQGGDHELSVVVDPEKALGDANRSNNEAKLFVSVMGEDVPPTITFLQPVPEAVLTKSVTPLRIKAEDDTGVGQVHACIDGGLWTALTEQKNNEWAGTCLMQPGEHRIQIRAEDDGGKFTEKTFSVRVETEKPEAEILYPQAGTNIQARATHVLVKVSPQVALVGARMAGYPWRVAQFTGRTARTHIPLYYGNQTIEVLVADRSGTVNMYTQPVTCTRQPLPGQKQDAKVKEAEPGLLRIRGLGIVDIFQQGNVVMPLPEKE